MNKPASPGGNISQNFSEIIFDFLIYQFSEKFWEIFQNFFKKFSIVSENSRIRNLIFEEKRRKFRFLKNSKKILPFFPEPGEIEKLKILEKSQKP